MINFTPWPLDPRQRTPVQNERSLGEPQSLSEHFGEEKNLLSLLGYKPRTIPTTLLGLLVIPDILFCTETGKPMLNWTEEIETLLTVN